MSKADVLDFMSKSDLAIIYCDKKRLLAIDSWPRNPDLNTSETAKKVK